MTALCFTAPEERTIHCVLERRAAAQAGETFFWFRGEAYSYGELDRMAGTLAKGLQQLGYGPGERVAVMLANRPEYLAAWFGLSKLGVLEVPINTAHRGLLLAYQLNQAQCGALIIERAFLPLLAAIIAELPQLRDVIVLDAEGEAVELAGKRVHRYAELTANDAAYAPQRVLWNDGLGIMFTSGTTGPSKGAVLPQNYALHTAEIITAIAGYDEKDCLYNALPLFHGNAKVLSTMPALYSGAKMVLAERFSASSFWDEVRRYGCTEFNYIGSILAILLKAEPRPDDADNPLRVLVGAGATPGVFEAFERRFGVTLMEGYGMTEIGLPLMSVKGCARPGSCGQPHPDYEVMLVDDDGRALGTGVAGELLVRPKKPWAMMLEYYGMADKTVEAWQSLWFHTGDYLKRDEEGYYWFLDRKKDAIRRRGENISSYEVERLVMRHPAVLEAAAVAAPSELGEDEVMVCAVLRPGASLAAEDLYAYCAEHMAKFMLPRYIRFVAALPKTPTEKLQKFRLREEGITADTWDSEHSAGAGE